MRKSTNDWWTAMTKSFDQLSHRLQIIRAEVITAFDRDHDLIGRVLKNHLLIESYLNKAIAYYQCHHRIDKLRFADKLKLLQPIMDETNTYFKGIAELNSIRNQIAHDLSKVIVPSDVNQMRPYAEVWFKRKIEDPIEVIEKFSLLAAALLSNQLDDTFGDLSKAYGMWINHLAKDPGEYETYFIEVLQDNN